VSKCIAKGRRQKAEGKRQKAKGRRQKAEGKRQKAKGRRQKAEGKRQFAQRSGVGVGSKGDYWYIVVWAVNKLRCI
jgi:uncharacterized protein YjbJ (UPF0337 family)